VMGPEGPGLWQAASSANSRTAHALGSVRRASIVLDVLAQQFQHRRLALHVDHDTASRYGRYPYAIYLIAYAHDLAVDHRQMVPAFPFDGLQAKLRRGCFPESAGISGCRQPGGTHRVFEWGGLNLLRSCDRGQRGCQ
jgi:hypothetical protein